LKKRIINLNRNIDVDIINNLRNNLQNPDYNIKILESEINLYELFPNILLHKKKYYNKKNVLIII